MKRALAVVASNRASVVLPVPGAPQRINDGKVPALSIKRRKIRPNPRDGFGPQTRLASAAASVRRAGLPKRSGAFAGGVGCVSEKASAGGAHTKIRAR